MNTKNMKSYRVGSTPFVVISEEGRLLLRHGDKDFVLAEDSE